jgi:hypothetical protein
MLTIRATSKKDTPDIRCHRSQLRDVDDTFVGLDRYLMHIQSAAGERVQSLEIALHFIPAGMTGDFQLPQVLVRRECMTCSTSGRGDRLGTRQAVENVIQSC